MSAHKIVGNVVKGYKAEFPRTYGATIEVLERIVFWMVFNPHTYYKVRSKAIRVTTKTTNRIITHLERVGYVTVLQGHGTMNGGGVPMVIKATDTLLNLR